MNDASDSEYRPGFLYSYTRYQQVMQLENCRDLDYRSQPIPANLVTRPLPGVDGGAIVEPRNFQSPDASKTLLQVWQQAMMLYV